MQAAIILLTWKEPCHMRKLGVQRRNAEHAAARDCAAVQLTEYEQLPGVLRGMPLNFGGAAGI
jgi:4'-phosphopantetheinyl transferase EntD